MQRVAVILFLPYLIKAVSLPNTGLNSKRLRLCVPEGKTNAQKTNCVVLGIENSGVECVVGNDRAQCLDRIQHDQADFGVFGPEDLVTAVVEDFGTVIAEIKTRRGRPFESNVVAVVGQKILADRQVKLYAVLKNRTLCHPGIDNGQYSAYTRTLNRYLEFLVQPTACSSEEDRIKTLADYFGRSCKAGPWVPDAAKDSELKRRYPSLCGVCASGTCSASDRYWGNLGALACVAEAGDVAWSELSDVQNFFGGSFYGEMKSQEFALLCPDYTTQTIAHVTDSCVWLQRPWPALVARSNKFLLVQKLLNNLNSTGDGYWRESLSQLLGMHRSQSATLALVEYPVGVVDYLARARGFLDAYSGQNCQVGPISNTFKCASGQEIPLTKLCNGPRDCADGSDETASACRTKVCQQGEFRCDYGACLAAGTSCNGKIECADGSDEVDKMCERVGSDNPQPVTLSIGAGKCVLPKYPAHGTYVVTDRPNAEPGQAFDIVHYKIFCNNGYGVIGNKTERVCVYGTWSEDAGDCVQFCSLNKDPSVTYHCLLKESVPGYPVTRPCKDLEPENTEVSPECNAPDYTYKGNLRYMRCTNGNWNYVAKCTIECGLVTPDGKGLIAGGGKDAKQGEMPWHAGIYSKTYNPYRQVCGGSLISQHAVISAAHCFWKESKAQPASNYAVAFGKVQREWIDDEDKKTILVQLSDVTKIHIPPRYLGAQANFQHDIAILELAKKIEVRPNVRPVCVDFDPKLEIRQLVEGRKGKVAGWGLKGADEGPSELLQVVELPYVGDFNCQELAPNDFKAYLTGDKFCAGYVDNGTALCEGDSGGGLTFPERDEKGIEKFYLRGITSTSRVDEDHDCNVNFLTTFTQLSSHQLFIRPFL